MFHNLLIKKALSYDNNNDGVCLGEGGGGGFGVYNTTF